MPVHDWSRVDAGIFHAFHHGWIEEIARGLNRGLLPPDYYALPEQQAAGFGPDVLTLDMSSSGNGAVAPADGADASDLVSGGVALAMPKLRPVAETDMAFYRRKQKTVTVRHVSGDRIVAIVEIVSPGNKSSLHAMWAFVNKAAELLELQIHLLMIDLHRPTPRDPEGIHGAVWEELAGNAYKAPSDKPFTLVAYEAGLTLRAMSSTWLWVTRWTRCPCFWSRNRPSWYR